ncbi:insulinase family protein [Clostridium fermenticellae]|uniref:Insulinase family protein n=1 Tax=Clostridium fermenticellae TaxID=2068654 RepID=A0A386H249_9CLOT|nr:pitrilysin family protein [Clostridium fermenticellae]AYD39736.1 insulinase family protein [Clostridium fermenticellae]
MFDVQEKILENGIKIATVKKDTKMICIHCGINIGSVYEDRNQRGISHFIEHMLFKGTRKRNNEQINSYLENLGGEYDAYTDVTNTVYSIAALDDELEHSLEILSDMLMNSTFPIEELNKEKEVILAEIRSSKDDIEDYSFKKVNEFAFDKSPLKYDTMGDDTTVAKFKRNDILEFYNKYYVPNNCYMSIVSPFNHDKVLDIVYRYFGIWKLRQFKRSEIVVEDNIPITKVSYRKDIEQSTIVYAFTFNDITVEQELALRVLNYKFGESANSILFRRLREEKGLAYDIYTDLTLQKHIKILYIYTAVADENIDKTLDTINSCINEIKYEQIIFDDDTINHMKKVLKTAIAFTLEDSINIGDYVLRQIINNEDIFKFITDIEELKYVKKEDIYNVARLVFDKPTIHIVKGRR